MHDATNKIRKLKDQLKQAENDKKELQTQVDLLQTIVNDLEKKLYTKQSAEGGAGQEEEEQEQEQEEESEADVVVGLTTQETDRLVRLQNCLQASIDACQHLTDENKALKEENKTLTEEKKELEKNAKELQSKIDNQSPTAAAGRKVNAGKKLDVSHLVNEVVAKDIVYHVKFVLCRNCKFVHTKRRMESLGKAVWEWVKKKHTLNEKTHEDFFEVYEASIKAGVNSNRMYLQQQTQKAARGE